MKQIKTLINDGIIENTMEFIFEHGKYKDRKYEAILEVACDNPVCTCSEMVIKVNSLDEKNLQNDGRKEEYLFGIDVKEKKLSSSFNQDISPENLIFAKLFVDELTADDWRVLYQYFYSYKFKLMENCNIDKLNVSFPDNIETGSMVEFASILPYAKKISIFFNDHDYIIEDQYCLSSSCNCTQSALTAIKLTEGRAIDGKNAPAFFFDYKSGLFKIDYYGSYTKDEVNLIFEEVKRTHKDISAVLKERHQILRKLYRKYKKKNNSEKADVRTMDIPLKTVSLKVGRNDPCPCGSGKKFKKCCGF